MVLPLFPKLPVKRYSFSLTSPVPLSSLPSQPWQQQCSGDGRRAAGGHRAMDATGLPAFTAVSQTTRPRRVWVEEGFRSSPPHRFNRHCHYTHLQSFCSLRRTKCNILVTVKTTQDCALVLFVFSWYHLCLLKLYELSLC